VKTAWYKKKWVIVCLHAAAWLLLFSLPYLLRPSFNENSTRPSGRRQEESFLFSMFMDLSWIALFYLNALLLIPKLVYNKKFWIYTGTVLVIFAWLMTQTWLLFQVFMPAAHYNFRGHLLITFFIFLFMLASSTAYKLIYDRIVEERLEKEKVNENLKTELSLLRSQVSPHFMFNVLNNMVALARKKSDDLESSLIKLSSLMRYMLYEADESTVRLEKEIEYLQSYIDLQRQRFGKNLKLNVIFNGTPDFYEIEPMLLIPFVENAFKHGTGWIENPEIDIELTAKDNCLFFSVRNKYNDATGEIKDKSSGIGLTNVKRRLNLLYGKSHTLQIQKDKEWFKALLEIKLH
jgi:LytS/YehU family sensor histidine kinase